ncbi:hypothetical protein CF319_g607 [Tilletia indica]|nr:hypothetical protein CF319_g607 [Tilletia indica]
MATAFTSRQQPQQRSALRSSNHATNRGREAPMDFAYEQPASSSSTNTPFLAALQSEAARRNQQRTAAQAPADEEEHDADMRDTSIDDSAHAQSSRTHPIRQYPVGSFALHRKRSQTRRSAGGLLLLGGASATSDDPRDTTMEDINAADAEQDDGFTDLEGDDQAGHRILSPTDQRSSSSALISRTHNDQSSSASTTAAPTINYFLAPFLPNPVSSQLQQHHQGTDSQSQVGHLHSHQSNSAWIGSNVHHMDWPELLLGHAQFIFNASLLAATLYLLFLIARTVQRDVEWKWLEYRAELETQIAACKTSYERNHCASPTLGVDFQAQCALWSRCMARDPDGVGRARVFAETVADIANGFVDRVSWKTMAFTLLCLFIIVGATNTTLSSYRHAYAARRSNYQSNRSGRGGQDRRNNKNGGGGGGRRRKGVQQGRGRGAIAME